MQPQALEITVSTGDKGDKYINELDLFHKTKQNVVKVYEFSGSES